MRTTAVIHPSPAALRGSSHKEAGLYLVPTGIIAAAEGQVPRRLGRARSLAGGPLAFTDLEILLRRGQEIHAAMAPLPEVLAWAPTQGGAVAGYVNALVDAMSASRAPFAGLPLDRPRVMGILNVTPDSFSDGGAFIAPAAAIAHGVAMLEAGADIIDVGGESTRPGAEPVAPDEEARRVLPVVRDLAERGARVSIDTRHAAVMAAAVQAGARIINDVTALTGDPDALKIAASSGAAVVLMHMRGEPRTMQDAPSYAFAPVDIFDALRERVAVCRKAGIATERLCVDPGIGFGKTLAHNVGLLGRLGILHGLGCAVMVGVSRKRFIADLSHGEPAGQRLAGSLAAALIALNHGASILRVHDVAETVQAAAVWQGIRGGIPAS
ncbi:MAG: dihydropteroate synthase [Alphaproteobacteria bacterium]